MWCFRKGTWIVIVCVSMGLGLSANVLGLVSYVVAAVLWGLLSLLRVGYYALPIVLGVLGINIGLRIAKTSKGSLTSDTGQGCGCLTGGVLGLIIAFAVSRAGGGPALARAAAAAWKLGPLGTAFFKSYALSGLPVALGFLLACVAATWGLLYGLRGLQWCSEAYRGISYTCPRCHFQHVEATPKFICPECNTRVSDLSPSSQALLFRPCPGPGCAIDHLPTTDLMGRHAMDAACSRCGAMLPKSVGAEYHIAIVGPARSGKTHFFYMAMDRFMKQFCPKWDVGCDFATEADEKNFKAETDALASGHVLAKTSAADVPLAYNFVVNCGWGDMFVYFYDPAGEFVERHDQMSRLEFVRYLDGLFFLVDAASIANYREHVRIRCGDEAVDKAKGADTEPDIVIGTVLNQLERLYALGPGMRIPVPTAVVVTKADFGDLQPHLSGNDDPTLDVTLPPNKRFFINIANRARHNSEKVRGALRYWGMGHLVEILDTHFSCVEYFSCSALGRSADAARTDPFEPVRVCAPLVWLLYQSRCLGNAGIDYVASGGLEVFWRALARRLAGRDGLARQFQAWLGVGLFFVPFIAFAACVLMLIV